MKRPFLALLATATLISLASGIHWLEGQTSVVGVITPPAAATPIKAVAGAAGDPAQIVCNGTPAIVSGTPQMSLYCIANGKVQFSEVFPAAITGVTIGINNGANAVTWQLTPTGWQVAANGQILIGGY